MEGIIVTPLTIISHPKGDILHGMKKSDVVFTGLGEAYFSTVKPNQIKGWNRHKLMTVNLIVPIGCVKFVIIDDETKKINSNNILEVELSAKNYQRLTVPPGLWIGFQCISKTESIVLNIADIEHDPEENESMGIDNIDYRWGVI